MTLDVDKGLAQLLAPPDKRYVLMCRDCRTVWTYERDCKTVKAARDGRAACPECDEALELARDNKPE